MSSGRGLRWLREESEEVEVYASQRFNERDLPKLGPQPVPDSAPFVQGSIVNTPAA